jgi:hypothetical protein
MFQLTPYGLAIIPLLLLFLVIVRDHYYVQSYCSPFPIIPSLAQGCASSCIKGPLVGQKALSLT